MAEPFVPDGASLLVTDPEMFAAWYDSRKAAKLHWAQIGRVSEPDRSNRPNAIPSWCTIYGRTELEKSRVNPLTPRTFCPFFFFLWFYDWFVEADLE